MTPVAGAPGLFDAPGGFDGEITAVRQPHRWLAVAGGSGLAQRIEVLRHLSTSLAWASADVAARSPPVRPLASGPEQGVIDDARRGSAFGVGARQPLAC